MVAKVVLSSPEQLHQLTRTLGQFRRYFSREALLFLTCDHVDLSRNCVMNSSPN